MNRQSRALLSVLLMGVIGLTAWRSCKSTPTPEPDSSTAIVISDTPTRGGQLLSSLRSEPRSFNRFVARDVPTELYSILTASRQWATRPAEERFTSLHELAAKLHTQRAITHGAQAAYTPDPSAGPPVGFPPCHVPSVT